MFKVVHRVEIESTEPDGEPFYITETEAPFVVRAITDLVEGGAMQLCCERNSKDGVLTVTVLGDCFDLRRQLGNRASRRGLDRKQASALFTALEELG